MRVIAGDARGRRLEALPGKEDESWQLFHDEAFAKFLNGSYAGAYETSLIETFREYLPTTPPWKQN